MFDGNLKILIADDEPPARARLTAMVNDIGGWNVIAKASNGAETLELCQEQLPDVVLLDIRMPGMDGIEVASHLCRLATPPAVIFTTAYDEYAVKAFETHAIAYLLKPVRRERLMRALEQAAKLGRMQLAQLAESNLGLGGRQRIPVSQAGRMFLVPVTSIHSFHADHKYVRMVYELDGRLSESLIDESLKALEQEFSADFARIHRNSLVRIASINTFERAEGGRCHITLHGSDQALPISRRHLSALKQRLQH